MPIDRIDPDFRLPLDEEALKNGNLRQVAAYLVELVKTLQGRDERLTQVANLGIDLNDGNAVYLGLKNSIGAYPIGTFRWIKVDSSVELQEKLTDTGVETDDWQKVASHSRS